MAFRTFMKVPCIRSEKLVNRKRSKMADTTTALYATNNTVAVAITSDDASWILTSSFVIFTMQTGFGLLESGACSKKNEVNIMMKNVVDVVLGGLFYWCFGYGLQFGDDPEYTTGAYGWGSWFVDADRDSMGTVFSAFIFQLSFCTTATTITSGAMAERTNYNAYVLFSLVNTLVYCIPAGWIWRSTGFLYRLGALDYAGATCVHLIGGISALVAAYMLGPRLKRYEFGTDPLPMGNPTNAIVGTFSLWWGWLGFNCGSTFGVSNNKWQFAERAAVTTLNGSFAGGLVAMLLTMRSTGKADVGSLCNGILAGLVAVTSGAGFFQPMDSLFIGGFGALLYTLVAPILDRFRIDDPVGAVAVHGAAGAWGALCVGLFAIAEPDILVSGGLTRGQCGLFKGCGFRLLGVQVMAIVCVALWAGVSTWILLAAIDKIVPIRMCIEEEMLGADFWIHAIRHDCYDYDSLVQQMLAEGLALKGQLDVIGQIETSFDWHRKIIDKHVSELEGSGTKWRTKNERLFGQRGRPKDKLVKLSQEVVKVAADYAPHDAMSVRPSYRAPVAYNNYIY
ncbi:putative ammonium transporter 3 [Halotydeus destructor]|nr:putative ammonium transporter 3 [Halotydeus destructor]